MCRTLPPGDLTETQPEPLIRTIGELPESLFGSFPESSTQPKSDLHARHFLEQYRHDTAEHPDRLCFLELDLGQSKAVNTDFIDGLLQELCRRSDLGPQSDVKLTSRMFFSNTRRKTIRALRNRNCNAFLMMAQTFCLFLDEVDVPHFVGVPRLTQNVHDVEECLLAIFSMKHIDESVLRSCWRVSDQVIDTIKCLCSDDPTQLFYHTQNSESGDCTFHAHGVAESMRAHRECRLLQIPEHIVPKSESSVVRLMNGTYVSGIVDCSELWSDYSLLLDCGKLMLSHSRLPPVNALVTFMHNGDRLASVIRMLTGISRLIILDPTRPQTWSFGDIDSNYGLVVDCLYPGDRNGYIGRFIQEGYEMQAIPKFVAALADFQLADEWKCGFGLGVRAVDGHLRAVSHGTDLLGTVPDIVTVVPPDFVWPDDSSERLPVPVQPEDGSTIFRAVDNRLVPSCASGADEEPLRALHASRLWQYSQVELSAEFWHNASKLGLISPAKSGREARDVLFFESNEKAIENHRTRVSLERFVGEFIRTKLELAVDVIIHPKHAVGAFIAQLVANRLSKNPLILSLDQPVYGGRIELSRDDIKRYSRAIDEQKVRRNKTVLKALIIDDSVYTGSSIFTMVGLCKTLGLQTVGVLVLMNRLTPGVSAAISTLPFEFGYIYRLHMPVMEENNSPNRVFESWAERLQEKLDSFFVRRWSEYVQNDKNDEEPSYFLRGRKSIEDTFDAFDSARRSMDVTTLDEEGPMQRDHFRQIVEGLILHPDPEVLDFYTRLAIACNFLEGLVAEPAFWKLLHQFIDAGVSAGEETSEISFVRKLIYVLAFSEESRSLVASELFRDTCRTILKRCLHDNAWVELPALMCDGIVGLAAADEECLLEFGEAILEGVARWALKTGDGKCEPARDVLGAFTWGLSALSVVHRMPLSDRGRSLIVRAFQSLRRDIEMALLCLDVYASFIGTDDGLAAAIGITGQNKTALSLLDELDHSDSPVYDYLANAPGYQCTLYTIMSLSGAHSVLLFAKNASDDDYFLRALCTGNVVSDQSKLKADQLKSSYLPGRLQSRMRDGLFFYSADTEELTSFDSYTPDVQHNWLLGAAVCRTRGSESYYVVLGYQATDCQDPSSTYCHWLDCERALRSILPAIHERYVNSSTAWNVIAQAIRTLHSLGINKHPRKQAFVAAITGLGLGNLLRRTLSVSTLRAQTPDELRTTFKDIEARLGNHLRDDGLEWPVDFELEAEPSERRFGYVAFNKSLVELILIECLCNAYTYHISRISIRICCTAAKDGAKLELWVENDYDHDIMVNENTTGISACQAAASAAKGVFRSEPVGEVWSAYLMLPGHRVPDKLTKEYLYDYFRR